MGGLEDRDSNAGCWLLVASTSTGCLRWYWCAQLQREQPAASNQQPATSNQQRYRLSLVPDVSAAISSTLSLPPTVIGMLHCASPVVVRKLTLAPAGTSQATNSPRQSVSARPPPCGGISLPNTLWDGPQRTSIR